MTNDKMQRRKENEMEYIQNDVGTFYYVDSQGVPYSGILYTLFDNGQIASERVYKEGYKAGPQKLWYPNGTLKEIACSFWDNPHGKCSSWNELGGLVFEAEYKYGRKIRSRTYDGTGALVAEYDIYNDAQALASFEKWVKRLESENFLKDWDVC